jgi:hypothetical protein
VGGTKKKHGKLVGIMGYLAGIYSQELLGYTTRQRLSVIPCATVKKYWYWKNSGVPVSLFCAAI